MKKALSLLLVAGMLTAALGGMAGATEESNPWRELPYYLSVTGTVVSVEELGNGYRIFIDDADGNPAHLDVTDRTVFPFASEVDVGDAVTGYYLTNAPMPLIWPPRYNIAVLVAGAPDDLRAVVDRFYDWEGHTEDFLLSQGGSFAFKVDENTEIVLANGDDFRDGDYVGRRIVAIYGVSTRSIPELATASKLIVLYEDIMALPDASPITGLGNNIDATGWPIHVNDIQTSAPEAFQTDDGFVMIPLRAVAEALGYKVKWDATKRAAILDENYVITIGDAIYRDDLGAAVIDGAPAPVLKNGSTYVPLQFFMTVLGMPNAFAFEGRIDIISEGERMD